jgi:integrase
MSSWEDTAGRRHVGVMVRGERIHRILPSGATAGDAKLIEAEIRASMARAAPEKKRINIPGDPMLTEVMALYIEHTANLRSPKTAVFHAIRFGPWAEKYRASQTRQAAAHFIKDAQGKYAASTINWSLSTLKKGLQLAYDADLIPVNYSDKVKTLPVHNIRDTVLTMEQLALLSAQCSDPVRTAVWIAIYTGCRRGEILAMRPEDIGEHSITVHAGNTKTVKTRTIPIVAPLRPWLARLPIGINFEGVKSGFRRARTAADLEWLNFHDLRRSCATMMIAQDVDLYVVSKLLGHSSVTVTQTRYGHLQTKRIAEGLGKTFK